LTAGSITGGEQRGRTRLSAADHRRLARRYHLRRYLASALFVAPSLTFFTLFMAIPVLRTVYLSFTSGGIITPGSFVGLRNWQQIAGVESATTALINTMEFALISVPLTIVFAFVMGVALSHVTRGAAVLRAMVYFPALAPGTVAALIWLFMVHPDFGAFNLIARQFGMGPVIWLGNETTALPTLAILDVWRNFGYFAVFFLAMIIQLPSELYEAAYLDGTNIWQRFRFLTLPLLRRAILFVVVIATIWGLQVFDTVFILTGGGPSTATVTVVYYVWNYVFNYDRIGYAAALSVVLLVIILALTLLQMRFLRSRKVG
jgi:ABC-type sugar transport system permease subunit